MNITNYLMTYGWAILIILIVAGVLAYYGIFFPGTLANYNCSIFEPQMSNETENYTTECYTYNGEECKNCCHCIVWKIMENNTLWKLNDVYLKVR